MNILENKKRQDFVLDAFSLLTNFRKEDILRLARLVTKR